MSDDRIVLGGGAALPEPGALHYAGGKLAVEVSKNAVADGFPARAITPTMRLG